MSEMELKPRKVSVLSNYTLSKFPPYYFLYQERKLGRSSFLGKLSPTHSFMVLECNGSWIDLDTFTECLHKSIGFLFCFLSRAKFGPSLVQSWNGQGLKEAAKLFQAWFGMDYFHYSTRKQMSAGVNQGIIVGESGLVLDTAFFGIMAES